jgi:hypothetical protein
MTRILMALLLAAIAAIAALPALARAGSDAAGAPILPAAQVATFAERVERDLAARDAQVAIVARMGRDGDLPEGIRYTHVAFWVHSDITDASGAARRGHRAWNLCQTPDDDTRSSLVQDSPADFFAGAHRLDAGVIIPDPRLQAKLPGVIASPTYAALHNPRYAVLANPATARFQNCTEPTLDVLMASLCGISDPARIKASIAAHFVPRPVRIGAIKRLLAPLASGALTTADHDGPIAAATFGAIARFMRRHDLAREIYRITPPRHTPSGTAPPRRSAFRDRAPKARAALAN